MKRMLWVAMFAIGCHETVSSPVETQESTLEAESPNVVDSLDVERTEKLKWSETHQIAQIDWTEVNKHQSASPGLLPAAQSAKIAGLGVPVLLPSNPELISRAEIVTGATWYAASMNHDGINVVIHGSKQSENLELNVTDEARELMRNFTVYRTHEIVTLTFNMYGVAYSLDIECAAPTTDDRCNKDETVMTMAENLVLAGGQP